MKKRSCPCRTGGSPSLPRVSPPRRSSGLAGLIMSGATLVLMPKCPVCMAAYLALCTGISLSATTASQLRMTLVSVCIAVPVIVTLAWMGRFYRKLP